MIASGLLPVLAGLLLLSMLLRPLSNRMYLPYEAVLLILGFLYGNLIEGAGALGLDGANIRYLVFDIFLPLLIFAAAFRVDAGQLGRNLPRVLILAVPMAAGSILLTAAMVYYGIGHASGFPWLAALLTAVMLSATDSHALRELMPGAYLNQDARTLLVGEDLLSGAMSIVLFTLLIAIAMNPQTQLSGADMALYLSWSTIGGALAGLGVGLAALVILRTYDPKPTEAALYTLLAAFLSYMLADLAGMSGVLAVLVAALIAGRTLHEDLDTHASTHRGLDMVDNFWRFFERLAASLLFLMIGLSITLEIFTERWLAILISIAAVLLARAIGLLVVRRSLTRSRNPLPAQDMSILYFTGTRGAITIGLAMSLPVELPYWYTVQAIGLGVVLFTLIAQVPLVEYWTSRHKPRPAGK